MVLSPDGRSPAYTEGDVIRLLDIRTRKAIGAPLTGHTNGVVGLAFSREREPLHPAARTGPSASGIYARTSRSPHGVDAARRCQRHPAAGSAVESTLRDSLWRRRGTGCRVR
jgi:hypothetical protein